MEKKKKRPVRTAMLGPRPTRHRITEETLDGFCDNGRGPREICVSDRLGPRLALETWIHEALHVEAPSMREATVDRAAARIARLLWRLEYRRNVPNRGRGPSGREKR